MELYLWHPCFKEISWAPKNTIVNKGHDKETSVWEYHNMHQESLMHGILHVTKTMHELAFGRGA